MDDTFAGLWNRTTDRSRKVLLSAMAAAQQGGYEDVRAEHLLHALYFEPVGVAGHVLKRFSWTPTEPAINYYRFGSVPLETLEPSEFLKGLLTGAMAEVALLRHHYAGTEHLLMALTRLHPECLTDPQAIRREVLFVLGHGFDE